MRVSRNDSIKGALKRIRRSFVSLAKAFDRLGPALSAHPAPSNGRAAATKSGRRRPRLSASQRTALKLQGRYMGTMRGLKRGDQAKVKARRKAQGIQAAISLARKLAARS